MAYGVYESSNKGVNIDDAVYRSLPIGTGTPKGALTDTDKFDYKLNLKQGKLTAGSGISLDAANNISAKIDSTEFEFDASGNLKVKPAGIAADIKDEVAAEMRNTLKISELQDSYKYYTSEAVEARIATKQDKLDAKKGIDKTAFANDELQVLFDNITIKESAEAGLNFALEVQDVKVPSVWTSTGKTKLLADIIPADVSWTISGEDNYLIDEDSVNYKISSQLGRYKGGYDTLAELLAKFPADPAGSRIYPGSGANGLRNNDYAYVGEPDSEGTGYWMIKYAADAEETATGSDTWKLYAWQEQYRFRVAAFTEAENKAIQSGITAERVAQYDDMVANALTITTGDARYKKRQAIVPNPGAAGNAVAFIDSISQNSEGKITVTKKTVSNVSTSDNGLMLATDKSKLDGIAEGAQKISATKDPMGNFLVTDAAGATSEIKVYKLPTASSDVLGGIKLGAGLSMDSEGKVSTSGVPTTYIKSITKDAVNTDKLHIINETGADLEYLPSTAAVKDITFNGTSMLVGVGIAPFVSASTTDAGLVRLGTNLIANSSTKCVDADNTSYTFQMVGDDLQITETDLAGSRQLPILRTRRTYGFKFTAGSGLGDDTVELVQLNYGEVANLNLPAYKLVKKSGDWNKLQIYEGSVLRNELDLHDNVITANATSGLKYFTYDKYGHVTGSVDKTLSRGIVDTANVIGHSNNITAGSKGPTADVNMNAATSFKVPHVFYDANGHITSSVTERTITVPVMTAATASAAGKQGLVPAPTAGANSKFLRGDGAWTTSGLVADFKVNGASVLDTSNVVNLITNSPYNASTNKIATMKDIADAIGAAIAAMY